MIKKLIAWYKARNHPDNFDWFDCPNCGDIFLIRKNKTFIWCRECDHVTDLKMKEIIRKHNQQIEEINRKYSQEIEKSL